MNHINFQFGVCRQILLASLLLFSQFAGAKETVVGSINGAFSVSPTGAATYTIPIEVMDGYSSFKPQISLVYNSQAGNGVAGFGWDISGLSSITRVTHSRYYDGNNISGINFDSNDAFSLDGQRLLLKSGTNGVQGAEYVTEEYNNCKIVISSGTSAPQTFKVYMPDGSVCTYGATTNGHLRVPYSTSSNIVSWLLDSQEDMEGNQINYIYTYKNNIPYLSEIQYGKNKKANSPSSSIKFNYGTRTDKIEANICGNKMTYSYRLNSISCEYCGNEYKKYVLTYDNSSVFSHLVSVREEGLNGCQYPETKFVWENLPDGEEAMMKDVCIIAKKNGYETLSMHGAIDGSKIGASYTVQKMLVSADVDNDGISEVVQVSAGKNVEVFSEGIIENKPFHSYNLGENFVYSNMAVALKGATVGHFTKDKRNLIVIPKYSEDPGSCQAQFNIPDLCRRPEERGEKELCFQAYYNLRAEGEYDGSSLLEKMPVYGIADFNKDGMDEIVLVETSYLEHHDVHLATISFDVKIDDDGYVAYEDFNYNIVPQDLHIRGLLDKRIRAMYVQDFDGDGLFDILLGCEDCCLLLWNNNGGFDENHYTFITNFGEKQIHSFADFNGDGLPD